MPYLQEAGDRWLVRTDEAYAFEADSFEKATPFFLKPSELGTYLFYDVQAEYLVSDGEALRHRAERVSALMLLDDTFVSEAEWELLSSAPEGRTDPRLRHRRTGRYLTADGLADAEGDATPLRLRRVAGCREHPEASLDATGKVTTTKFPDGSLFGLVDTHSRILSNFGLRGAGIFHGTPFARLGVEHALPDCELFHGEEGRRDLSGFGFDNQDQGLEGLLPAILTGETALLQLSAICARSRRGPVGARSRLAPDRMAPPWRFEYRANESSTVSLSWIETVDARTPDRDCPVHSGAALESARSRQDLGPASDVGASQVPDRGARSGANQGCRSPLADSCGPCRRSATPAWSSSWCALAASTSMHERQRRPLPRSIWVHYWPQRPTISLGHSRLSRASDTPSRRPASPSSTALIPRHSSR